MAKKCLLSGLRSEIPELASSVYGTGDVGVIIGTQAYADYVTSVSCEISRLLVRLQVPDAATKNSLRQSKTKFLSSRCLHLHVAGAGDNVAVVQESTGRQEALVAEQLPGHLGHSGCVTVVDVVNGALVVHTSAGDEVTRLGERDRHNPGRAQRNDLDLVAGPRVPDDEFPVERARNAVPV